MARTIKEISQNIKAAFISNPVIKEAYSLIPDKTFDEQFSAVSIETVLFQVVASAIWLLEKLWDTFRSEVEEKVDNSYITSIAWYYHKALQFQLGDPLIFDEKTYSYKYAIIDENRRIIKNVAIREVVIEKLTTLRIYFSDEMKKPITGEHKEAFKEYMHQVGAAGTHYEFISQAADKLRIGLEVYYDPLVIDSKGLRLKGSGKPVEETISSYLNSLEYGGTFYGIKLVDMLQTTEGVKDVVLGKVILENADGTIKETDNRKIESDSGSFDYLYKAEDITYSIY